MAGKRPVLLMVKAASCPHCVEFEKRWPVISAALTRSGLDLRVEEIVVPTPSSPLDRTRYPPDLARLVRWFPTLLLLPGADWEAAKGDRSFSFHRVAIFNGRLDEKGNVVPERRYSVSSPEHFVEWVRSTVESAPFRTPAIPPLPLPPLPPQSSGVCNRIRLIPFNRN